MRVKANGNTRPITVWFDSDFRSAVLRHNKWYHQWDQVISRPQGWQQNNHRHTTYDHLHDGQKWVLFLDSTQCNHYETHIILYTTIQRSSLKLLVLILISEISNVLSVRDEFCNVISPDNFRLNGYFISCLISFLSLSLSPLSRNAVLYMITSTTIRLFPS
jgi:hypothetical protein